MNTIKLPATADVVIDFLIRQGHDAGTVLRTVTRVTGSAYIGTKITGTTFNKIVAELDGPNNTK